MLAISLQALYVFLALWRRGAGHVTPIIEYINIKYFF
jgi:hypothetical protein